jgi:hypothetical protein
MVLVVLSGPLLQLTIINAIDSAVAVLTDIICMTLLFPDLKLIEFLL